MKNLVIQAAVVSALGLASSQAMANPGFVNIPGTGFATSAYTICNPTGDFGSGASTEPKNEAGTARVCATFPNNGATDALKNTTATPVPTPYGSVTTTPVAGFTLAKDVTSSVIMNNSATGNVNNPVATVRDMVWKDAAGTSCIYGTRVHMNSTANFPANDTYRLIDGTYWEVNDIARAGFANFTASGAPTAAGAMSVAYFRTAATDEVTFRAGRTYSAVQHHSAGMLPAPILPIGTDLPGTTAPSPGAPQSAIVGVASTTGTVTPWLGYSAATPQTAAVSANWIDFTTDINAQDPDLSSFPDSSLNYVRVNKTAAGASGCPAGAVAAWTPLAGAIRLRSTGQEDQKLIEVSVAGYAPSGANVNP